MLSGQQKNNKNRLLLSDNILCNLLFDAKKNRYLNNKQEIIKINRISKQV